MRYHFKVRYHGLLKEDPEGIELDGLDTVRREAIGGARDIIAERIKTGTPLHIDTMFEVRDESGDVVLMLSFASVLLAALQPPTPDWLGDMGFSTHDAPALAQ